MVRAIYVLFVAVFALVVSPAFAQVQQGCGSHASFIAQLDLKFGEARLGSGMAGGILFELWASEETGTWTLLRVFPTGWSCIKAAGEGWHTDPKKLPGEPT